MYDEKHIHAKDNKYNEEIEVYPIYQQDVFSTRGAEKFLEY